MLASVQANPVFDRGPMTAVRDPALITQDGVLRCFHTAVEPHADRYRLYVDVIESPDLRVWSAPRRLTTSELNFSSPGNVIKVGGEWVLCVQSYPVPSGQKWGSEDSRLWLMRSDDLDSWTAPEPMHPAGCQATWTTSHRQIDPYLVAYQDRYWCFYKTSGQLGLLVSDDLHAWQEAVPDRPVLGSGDTPDGATVENPCVVPVAGGFALFFAPCREGRGIGVAYSHDLLAWRDVHYLDFPALPWADGGPTAAVVLDMHTETGDWLMMFHGERHNPRNAHDAALGVAWSQDLEHWELGWGC